MNHSIRTQGTPPDLARRPDGPQQPVFEARAAARRGDDVYAAAPSTPAHAGPDGATAEEVSATEVRKEAVRYCW